MIFNGVLCISDTPNGSEFDQTEVMQDGAKAIFSGLDNYTNFSLNARIMINTVGADGGASDTDMMSRAQEDGSGYWALISSEQGMVALSWLGAGGNAPAYHGLGSYAMDIDCGVLYQMRITAVGSDIQVFVDDTDAPKVESDDCTFSSGTYWPRSYGPATMWSDVVTQDPVSTACDFS